MANHLMVLESPFKYHQCHSKLPCLSVIKAYEPNLCIHLSVFQRALMCCLKACMDSRSSNHKVWVTPIGSVGLASCVHVGGLSHTVALWEG